MDDPRRLDLHGMFRDPDMFESRSSWEAAGFEVLNRSSNGKIMVACNPLVNGLVFKKYTSAVSQKDQRKNYECRLEGTHHLRAFVEDHKLARIAVPRKWIVTLPEEFAHQDQLLVAERFELLDSKQSANAYRRIDDVSLNELCRVLFYFRGMDSNVNNLPFLTDGRIGLVDTEHWKRGTHKNYLQQVGEYMSSESLRTAEKIFRQLRHENRYAGPVIHDEDSDVGNSSESLSSSSSSSSS